MSSLLASRELALFERSFCLPYCWPFGSQSCLDSRAPPTVLVFSASAQPFSSKMGCTQSTTYYFGFINFSLSHLDILSFALGVVLTLGVQYLFQYCKHTRRASRHVLGKSRSSRRLEPHPLRATASCYPFSAPWPFSGAQEEPPATAPPVPPGMAIMPWPPQCS